MTLLFFLKAAWEDVWKGFTAYLTQNPNKIVQIKRVTSLCPLQEYLGNFLGHQRYAYLKSSQVSEQCHFVEAKCVITGVTVVELVGVPRPNSRAGNRVCGSKRVLIFCCTYLKIQRVMLNLRIYLWTLVIERIQMNWAPKMQCGMYKTRGQMNLHTLSLLHWDDPHWKRADCF